MTRRLLCEGWIEEGVDGGGEIFYPEIICVQQEGKVWAKQGGDLLSERLDESFEDGVTLVENYDDLELVEVQLDEGRRVKLPKNGKWIVEGVFQRSDVENANKRSYPRAIWERDIADSQSVVQKRIGERAMIGHVEHPKDGRTDLNESAIITTKATLRADGTVWGRAELLETDKGKLLQRLTAAGVKWGVSSRGNGTVGADGKVNEDFTLTTWDAVASPSTPGAFPSPAFKKPVQTSSKTEDVDDDILDEAKSRSIDLLGHLTQAQKDIAAEDIAAFNATATKLSKAIRDAKSAANDVSEAFNVVSDAAGRGNWKLAGTRLKRMAALAKTLALVEDVESDDAELLAEGSYKNRIVQLQKSALAARHAADRGDAQGVLTNLKQAEMHIAAARKFILESRDEESHLTEDADDLITRARGLCESSIDGLDTEDRGALVTNLLDVFGQTMQHQEAGTLPAEKASEVFGWLHRRLGALHESGGLHLDAVLEAALASGAQDTDALGEDGTDPVSLREQLEASMSEAEDVRSRAAVVESDLIAMRDARDALSERLASVEQELVEANDKLDVADGLLSESAAAPAEQQLVVEMVETLIGKDDTLEQHRALLTLARTPEEVQSLAEHLGQYVVSTPESAATGGDLPGRLSIPNGVVSEDMDPIPSEPAQVHEGAVMAGRALKGMGKLLQG